MKQRKWHWLKLAISAAIIPAMLLGLVAFEQTDTGQETVSGTELESIVFERAQRRNAPDVPGFGFSRSRPDRRPPVEENAEAGVAAGDAITQAGAAIRQAERALATGNPLCAALRDVLEAALDAVRDVIDTFENVLPDSVVDELRDLVDELERLIRRLIRFCNRFLSGFFPFP